MKKASMGQSLLFSRRQTVLEMKKPPGLSNSLILFMAIILIMGCGGTSDDPVPYYDPNGSDEPNPNDNPPEYANIDFSNWKVTLPVDENNNGSPDEYKPDQLVNNGYRTLEAVMPFMYDDTTDGSIVFYTYPDVSTTNSSYSRTELRELINPSNARENWTLLEGGIMTGKLKFDKMGDLKTHKLVGKLTNIADVVKEDDMPPKKFLKNNPKAALSAEEKELLVNWAESTAKSYTE